MTKWESNMNSSVLSGFLFIALTASGAAAPDVKNTSFTDENGQKVQQLTMVVDAPASTVWKALTTDEGFKSWAAPVAHIELKNDGVIEASYSLASEIGDPDNIRNQIIAYVPERILVLHNVHVPKSSPADFALLGTIRTIIELVDLGHGRTRITQSGVGYGESADYDALFKHFSAGNIEEFSLLAQSLAGHPVAWKAEAAPVKASVGDQSH
jgi:uncharacterized protein YndB with AHSA1/START domain